MRKTHMDGCKLCWGETNLIVFPWVFDGLLSFSFKVLLLVFLLAEVRYQDPHRFHRFHDSVVCFVLRPQGG